MSKYVLAIGEPSPLPFEDTTDAHERMMQMSSLDSPDATKLVDDAVNSGVIDAGKRHQLLLLARHHGIDSARTAIRLIATARVTRGQREVLEAIGVSPLEYLEARAKKEQGDDDAPTIARAGGVLTLEMPRRK